MKELFAGECKNRDFFLEMLKQKIPKQNYLFKKNNWNLMIDKEVPVPYRHIYFPVRNELEIWCFKQDICIYTKLLDKSIRHRGAAITVGNEKILKVVLYKNASNNKRDIGLPLVIIETKMSEKITTHELLAYSEKIRMIKSIFPYCRAYLLCFGHFKRSVYRHGLGFDESFNLENFDDKRCEDVIKKISNSLKYAAGRMIETA
jgi:hypothetical protein